MRLIYAVFILLLTLISSAQCIIVFVDSGSMSPNLDIRDLVVVEDISKRNIITYDEAELTGYKSFNKSGDVILYRSYGPYNNKTIISRALRYVETGEPMWDGGPIAPFSGYITKGDHNEVIDQMAGQIFGAVNKSYIEANRGKIMDVGSGVFLDKQTGLIIYETKNGTFVGEGISFLTPVKKEWVVGVARSKNLTRLWQEIAIYWKINCMPIEIR